MAHNLNDSIAVLSRTPAALDALLRGLPAVWTQQNEGEGAWSVFDVIVHLVHCDRDDWIQRARTILQYGEEQVLSKVNRAGGDDDHEGDGRTLEQFLEEFAQLRAKNLDDLRTMKLTDADLAKRGRHPVFGPVTLSQLLATWAAHDLTHLHQISRVMAHQHREAVGPWIAYLGVMHCTGHGA